MNREQAEFEVCGTHGMKAIELCAGGGGSSLGLESAGFTPAVLIDDEPNACATLRHNRPHWNIIEDDLRKADFRNMKDIALVSGGLPCPPYSIAGVQRGSADERDLFPEMLRIVQDVMPSAVLIENVRGLMSSKFVYVREYVDNELRDMGFVPKWKMLNASGFRSSSKSNTDVSGRIERAKCDQVPVANLKYPHIICWRSPQRLVGCGWMDWCGKVGEQGEKVSFSNAHRWVKKAWWSRFRTNPCPQGMARIRSASLHHRHKATFSGRQ